MAQLHMEKYTLGIRSKYEEIGSEIKSHYGGTYKLNYCEFELGFDNCTVRGGGGLLLTNGKWAEVVEDKFVLPEKWCILSNSENYKILTKWLKDNSIHYKGFNSNWEISYKEYYLHFPQASSDAHSSSMICDGYKEITFEQFKEYVLKKNKKGIIREGDKSNSLGMIRKDYDIPEKENSNSINLIEVQNRTIKTKKKKINRSIQEISKIENRIKSQPIRDRKLPEIY